MTSVSSRLNELSKPVGPALPCLATRVRLFVGPVPLPRVGRQSGDPLRLAAQPAQGAPGALGPADTGRPGSPVTCEGGAPQRGRPSSIFSDSYGYFDGIVSVPATFVGLKVMSDTGTAP